MALPPDFIEMVSAFLERIEEAERALADAIEKDPEAFGYPKGVAVPRYAFELHAKGLIARATEALTRKAGELAFAPTNTQAESIES